MEGEIRLEELCKKFDDFVAVDGIDIEMPPGEFFTLLGPSGCGKTTTLRMVLDILGPDSGEIEILGRPADHAARDRIGYMPEERGLYPRMVLEEQLVFMAAIKGVRGRAADTAIASVCARLTRFGGHVDARGRVERAPRHAGQILEEARNYGPLADGQVVAAHGQPGCHHLGRGDGGAKLSVGGDAHAATFCRPRCLSTWASFAVVRISALISSGAERVTSTDRPTMS